MGDKGGHDRNHAPVIIAEGTGSAHDRNTDRELHLHFLRTPVELLPREGDTVVGSVKLEANVLQAKGDGSQEAVGTGEHEILPVGSFGLIHDMYLESWDTQESTTP